MLLDERKLESIIKNAFPDDLINLSFVILNEKLKKIILFLGKPLHKTSQIKVEKLLKAFPEIEFIEFIVSNQIRLTGAMVLSEIKTNQPVSFEMLNNKLKGLEVIYEEFEIKRFLDKLRKSKKVLRLKSGLYVITEFGLSQIPQGNGRNSTDIKRILELAKRK